MYWFHTMLAPMPDKLCHITLNGEPRDVAAATLAAVLEELGFGSAKVATAINGAFVPVVQRAEQTISEGDRLEVVSARAGG